MEEINQAVQEGNVQKCIELLQMIPPERPTVILIHGKANSGKSYTAKRIQKELKSKEFSASKLAQNVQDALKPVCGYEPVTVAFADLLKAHLFATDKIQVSDLTAPDKTAAYREILISTADTALAHYGAGYFAKALQAQIMLWFACNEKHVFIVPDLRTKCQLEIMEQSGCDLIKITINAKERVIVNRLLETDFDTERAGRLAAHISETDLDDWLDTRELAESHGFIFVENDFDAQELQDLPSSG